MPLSSLLPVVVLAGCGGAASTSSTTPSHSGFVLEVATPTRAAVCLNEDQFLVQPGPRTVRGSSPEGVNFTVRFYSSAAAANAARARAERRFTARFATVVVDFGGNPPPRPGGAPRVLKHVDLVTIRHCVLRRSGSTAAG